MFGQFGQPYRNWFWACLAGLFLFLAAGCSALYPVDPATRLVFQDDFSDPESGWPVLSNWQGQVGYARDSYQMTLLAPGANLSAALPTDYIFPADVEIQVGARSLGGPQDNRFGLICRYQNALNYYWFVISSDGYYGIGKVKNGQITLLNAPQMPPSEQIKRGQELNSLRVECVGDRLRLYVNELLLGEQQDADFSGGSIGFLVGAGSQANVQVGFEHLVVKEAVR